MAADGRNTNFDAKLRLGNRLVTVSGTTEADQAATGEFVSRHVALQQDQACVHGSVPGIGANWSADLPVADSGLSTGKAAAVGVETYFVKNPIASRFVTLTWAQVVDIEGPPA